MDDKRNLEGLTPMVTVTTKNLGDQILISISDNGPGIPDAINIFQPFFSTKGLSLAYVIVTAHGGDIKVSLGILAL